MAETLTLTVTDRDGVGDEMTVDSAPMALAACAVATQAESFAIDARRHYEIGNHAQGDRDLADAEALAAVARLLWRHDSDVHPGLTLQSALARRLRVVKAGE